MGFTQMPGRGTLTYSLDPDGQTVLLRWESKGGSCHEWTGPVPVIATSGYLTRMHHGLLRAVAAFGVLAAAGAGLGELGGSVVAGLVSGLMAGYLTAATLWGRAQMRAFREARAHMFGR